MTRELFISAHRNSAHTVMEKPTIAARFKRQSTKLKPRGVKASYLSLRDVIDSLARSMFGRVSALLALARRDRSFTLQITLPVFNQAQETWSSLRALLLVRRRAQGRALPFRLPEVCLRMNRLPTQIPTRSI